MTASSLQIGIKERLLYFKRLVFAWTSATKLAVLYNFNSLPKGGI